MPDASVSIRRLTRADVPAALAIQLVVYTAFLVEDARAFASRIDLSASCCLAATRGGELVAYLLAHGWPARTPPPIGAVLEEPAASEVLFIHDLAVSAAGRGTGVGRMLVERAFARAAGKGLTSAELIAVEGAATYWRRLGFGEPVLPPAVAAKVAAYGAQARWMERAIG